MKQKVQIHEWKSQLYAVRIWIAVTNNINDLDNKFYDYRSEKDLEEIQSNHACFCQLVVNKESKNIGTLIIFTEKKYLIAGKMAHEATHAAREIWEYIGETQTGYEADAYLVEWIVDLMEQVRKNKFIE
jgi:hypothetical protein